jgi:hypothetical protein
MVASRREERTSMNWVKRHDLIVFLVLAFALSWWVWPFVLLTISKLSRSAIIVGNPY